MTVLRHHIALRFFCFLMALHILNCSADAPDLNPEWVPEDLSYNDIETIAELVVEHVWGIENAFPEHDENDSHVHFLKKLGSGHFYLPPVSPKILLLPPSPPCHRACFCETQEASQHLPEVNSPPPWA